MALGEVREYGNKAHEMAEEFERLFTSGKNTKKMDQETAKKHITLPPEFKISNEMLHPEEKDEVLDPEKS